MTHLADPLLPAGKTVPVPISSRCIALWHPWHPQGGSQQNSWIPSWFEDVHSSKIWKIIRFLPIIFFDDEVKWRLSNVLLMQNPTWKSGTIISLGGR